MSFKEGDLYAWSEVLVDDEVNEKMIDMDAEILDMSIRDISNLLGEQYEKNVGDCFHVAALVMKGFNIHTGKRMCLQISLLEDSEEDGLNG